MRLVILIAAAVVLTVIAGIASRVMVTTGDPDDGFRIPPPSASAPATRQFDTTGGQQMRPRWNGEEVESE